MLRRNLRKLKWAGMVIWLLTCGAIAVADVRIENPSVTRENYATQVRVLVRFVTFDNPTSQLVSYAGFASEYTTSPVVNKDHTVAFVNLRPVAGRIEIFAVWASDKYAFSSSNDFGTILMPLLEKAGIKCSSPNVLYIESNHKNVFHVVARRDGPVPGFEFDIKFNKHRKFSFVPGSYVPDPQ